MDSPAIGSPPSSPSLSMLLQLSSSSASETPVPNKQGQEDERAPAIKKPPTPPQHRSCPERIVVQNRTIHKPVDSTRLFTDAEHFYALGIYEAPWSTEEENRRVAERIMKHALCLNLEMMFGDGSGGLFGTEAQACVVKMNDGYSTATAKHNFCTDLNENTLVEEEVLRVVAMSVSEPNRVYKIGQWSSLQEDFRTSNLDSPEAFRLPGKGSIWKYGNEVVLTPLNEEHNKTLLSALANERIIPFEIADLDIEIGMEIGILASSCSNGSLASTVQNEFRGSQYSCEESQRDTFITVGTITDVSPDHVEYQINTVKGFSGAPVFLLDPNDSTKHMKLIAVHSGYSTVLNSNFGFRVPRPTIGVGCQIL